MVPAVGNIRSAASWRSGARFLSLVVAFVAGFALVAAGFRYVCLLAGLTDSTIAATKLRQAVDQRPDVIFVGPSHIATSIIPEVFDAEFSKYQKVHSYNFALGGADVPEIEFVLDKLFATGPCCIKYVVIFPEFGLTNLAKYPDAIRAIDYFDVVNAFRYWSFLRAFDPNVPPQIDLVEYARNIAFATLRHYSNIGLGLSLLGIPKHELEPPNSPEFRWSARGHLENERVAPEAEWHKHLDEYTSQSPGYRDQAIPDELFSSVTSIIDLVERHGARAIMVRPPSIWMWHFDLSLVRKFREKCPAGPPLLDFGDPAAYPELYERRNHIDDAHLNTRGAAIWSRILADQIGELVRSGRLDRPATCGDG